MKSYRDFLRNKINEDKDEELEQDEYEDSEEESEEDEPEETEDSDDTDEFDPAVRLTEIKDQINDLIDEVLKLLK